MREVRTCEVGARPVSLIFPSNAELNLICCLLVLLGAHPILHISWIRVTILKLCLVTVL